MTTVMTTVTIMRILLVMTISVITLPRVFGGEVSVSRHFKGDIFSQEGNNKRILAVTQNNPYLGVGGEKSSKAEHSSGFFI